LSPARFSVSSDLSPSQVASWSGKEVRSRRYEQRWVVAVPAERHRRGRWIHSSRGDSARPIRGAQRVRTGNFSWSSFLAYIANTDLEWHSVSVANFSPNPSFGVSSVHWVMTPSVVSSSLQPYSMRGKSSQLMDFCWSSMENLVYFMFPQLLTHLLTSFLRTRPRSGPRYRPRKAADRRCLQELLRRLLCRWSYDTNPQTWNVQRISTMEGW